LNDNSNEDAQDDKTSNASSYSYDNRPVCSIISSWHTSNSK